MPLQEKRAPIAADGTVRLLWLKDMFSEGKWNDITMQIAAVGLTVRSIGTITVGPVTADTSSNIQEIYHERSRAKWVTTAETSQVIYTQMFQLLVVFFRNCKTRKGFDLCQGDLINRVLL